MKPWLVIIVFVLMSACSGGGSPERTPIIKPSDIAISNQPMEVSGSLYAQFGYVLDPQARGLIVIDVLRDKVFDPIIKDDWNRSVLPVPSEATSVVVDDGVEPHRVLVSSRQANQIVGYSLKNTQVAKRDDFEWQSVDLGGPEQSIASKPLFYNLGSLSQLTLQNLEVNDLSFALEGWSAIHKGSLRFEIESSKRGVYDKKVAVGTDFTTQEGDLSFSIQEGSREASDSDRFYFVTSKVKPLSLDHAPLHMEVYNRTLWVVTSLPSMIAVDLDTFAVLSETPLTITQPGHVTRDGAMLLIPDVQGQNADQWDMETETLSQTISFAWLAPQTLHSVTQVDDFYYPIVQASRKLHQWPVGSSQPTKTLTFASQPTRIASYNDGGSMLAVGFVQGEVELIRASTFKRQDTNLDTDADFRNKRFFDQGPKSSPELLSVSTFADKTLTESWQLSFEALLPGTILEAVIAGNSVTFSGVDLTALGGLHSDGLYVQLEDKTYDIANVGTTVVTLTQAPSTQGSTMVGIQATNSYVVFGSSSGYQINRLFSDEDYHTDEGQIALRIRSSIDRPATRGDFFSFQTIDEITPLRVSGRSNVQGLRVFTKLNQSQPTAYVLYQSNAALAQLKLKKQSVGAVIR